MRRFVTLSVISLLIGWSSYATSGLEQPRCEWDEFVGAVRNVRTEIAELSNKSGSPVEGTRLSVSDCSYDESGNLVESVVYKADGTPFKRYKAAYDPGRPRLEESYYEPKGALDVRFISEYDSAARKAETTRYSSKGAVTGKTIYSVDAAGRAVEEVSFGAKGSVVSRIVTVYKDASRISESICYGSNEHVLYAFKTLHDSEGRDTDVAYYAPDGRPILKWASKYDDKSNLVEETFDAGAGIRQWRYAYEFDSDGNWLKRKTLQLVSKPGGPEFTPVTATYRSITYYARAQNQAKRTSPVGASNKALAAATSLLNAEATRREPPAYPFDAKTKRIYGKVVVLVIVDEFGKVISAQAADSPDRSLSLASEEAAARWRFSPAIKAGRSVRDVGTLDFNFNP